MAVTLNALTTGVGGLQTTGDTSGEISLQSNGSTVVAVTASGVSITGTLSSTTALPATSGGTGLTSAGTLGNVLTSDGTNWTSAALPAGGVTSLNGQTGAITNTDLYAIGSYINGRPNNYTNYAVDNTVAGSSLYTASPMSYFSTGTSWANPTIGGSAPATLVSVGTWRCLSPTGGNGVSASSNGLWVRIS
jgi:hypothetical protein